MNCKIAVIPGDGIGPEIMREAIRVLDKIAQKYGHSWTYMTVYAGGTAIDVFGEALPEVSLQICKTSDCVLLGAVGGPKWDDLPGDKRPESALLALRSALGVYANLRPVKLFATLAEACPFRPEISIGGLDMMIVRELTGGVYFGEHGRKQTALGETGYDVMQYGVSEVERLGRVAFAMAMQRRRKLVSVDKANVLETSRVWRETMQRLSREFPEVAYEDMLVDNAAMQLIRDPRQFDVIATGNMFGDILSDEASMLTGSIGMLPSASLGEGTRGMYEPIHGSAPDIEGLDKANPLGMILSAAMLLRHTCGLTEEADAIEAAVGRVLEEGFRTADIMREGMTLIGTEAMGAKVEAYL